MSANSYDKDVVLWAPEQAALLRSGQFSNLDIEHIADEIEDVGKTEKRELASRMAVLMAFLLKWRGQPDRRSRSWRSTINEQRKHIALALDETPSLRTTLNEAKWWADARHGDDGHRSFGRGVSGRMALVGRPTRRLP
jgi:hypothetical protein